MAKTALSNCDKMVRRALFDCGCQTTQELKCYSNRKFNEDYSTGAIGAALRKMVERGLAAHSENEKGQKVYWMTPLGEEAVAQMIVKGEL